MKKEIALILTATCLAGALSSCRGEEDNALSDTNDTHPVTTQTTGTSESTAGLKVPTDTQPPAAPSVVTDAQGLTYINGILVVNKTYALPSTYDPGVDSEAYAALQEMFRGAAAENVSLEIVSGYRSFPFQNLLCSSCRYPSKELLTGRVLQGLSSRLSWCFFFSDVSFQRFL